MSGGWSAHLGERVTALLDGQLEPREAERAWAHVHTCHLCRDQVEREGWVKTRLAGLGQLAPGAPADLKGSLLASWPLPPGEALALACPPRPRRTATLAAIGGGAAGAAMMGVLALGAAPATAPTLDRRAPTPATSITQPGPFLPAGLQRRHGDDPRPDVDPAP